MWPLYPSTLYRRDLNLSTSRDYLSMEESICHVSHPTDDLLLPYLWQPTHLVPLGLLKRIRHPKFCTLQVISCVHSSHTYQTHFYYFYIFCFVLYFLIIPQPKQGYISNFLLFMILSSRCSLSKFQFYVLFLLWNSSLRHWVFCSELFLVFHFYFLVLVSIWIQCLHPTSVFHFFFWKRVSVILWLWWFTSGSLHYS